MKRHSLTILLILLAFPAPVPAQALRGSYFFETSLMRGKLNPAFAPRTSYISVPVLGQADVDILSNVGLGNFLFPDGDKTYTFLSDQVSEATFYDKLPDENPYLRAHYESDLIGGGYKLNDRIFLTAGLSLAGDIQADIPHELLRFAKTGRSGGAESWDIRDITASYLNHLALSLGCTYDLQDYVPGLYAGARFKLMTGLRLATATLNATADMNDERIAARTDGTLRLSGFSYDPEKGFSSDGLNPKGFGAALDLGLEYRFHLDGFLNGINLSVSVCDLGFMSYGSVGKLLADGDATFAGFQDIDVDFDFQTRLKAVLDDFAGLTELKDDGTEVFKYKLSPRLTAGVELPFFNEMMSAGLLYTERLSARYLTVSYNVSPLDWLNLSADYTFGPVNQMGFYAEFIPKRPVGFFIGFNKASLKTNKYLLGIKNLTGSCCLGLNVLF